MEAASNILNRGKNLIQDFYSPKDDHRLKQSAAHIESAVQAPSVHAYYGPSFTYHPYPLFYRPSYWWDSTPCFWPFGRRVHVMTPLCTPTYTKTRCNTKEKSKKNEPNWLLAATFVLLTLLPAYFLGRELASLKQQKSEIRQLTDLKSSTQDSRIKKIADTQIEIHKSLLQRASTGFGLKALFGLSAAAGAIGAAKEISSLVSLGTGGLILSIGAYLVFSGYTSGDTTLLEGVDHLNSEIREYEEEKRQEQSFFSNWTG